MRPIQDFYIQIPHKKVNVPERNSGPGEMVGKHQPESEWYVKLCNQMRPSRDKAEKKLRILPWKNRIIKDKVIGGINDNMDN